MREMKSTLLSAFYVGILFIAGLNATVTQGPSNTVAEMGKQVKLSCTADAPVGYWILSKDGSATGQLIIVGPGCGTVNAPFGNHYTIEPIAGGTTCNLNIYDITMEQGGVYKCVQATSVNASIFTVIDPNLSITVTNGSGVVAGDQVTMSYTVIYNSSTTSSQTPTIQPVLSWTASDGKNIIGSPTPGVNSVTSILSLRAERQAMQPYTCSISYEIKGASTANGISFADNIPNSVSTPRSTPSIDVLYAPEILSLEKSDEVPKCPGETVTITCYASANPPATYSWIGPHSRNYSGPTVAADMNGVYTCTASNAIKGSTRSTTNTTTLNAFEYNCTRNDKTTPSDEPKCSIVCIIVLIVIGAYIMGNVIATVVFLVYYNRNIGFKRTLNDRFSWLKKMLPCMNDDVACGCGWIFLSVCVFALVGMLFTICMVVISNRSQGRSPKRSENNAHHFHNPRNIRHSRENDEIVIQDSTLGANEEGTYEEIRDGKRLSSQDKNRENKDKNKQQNEQEKGQPKSVKKNTHQSPSLPPPNPHSQQPTTAQGTVYSDLPVTNHNVQPEQYIEGNTENNYSELTKT